MSYMTVKEAAEKWGLVTRVETLYCAENRIAGAVKRGNLWLIPACAKRPADKRCRDYPERSLSADFDELLAATTVPAPADRPDSILDSAGGERNRLP
jgi:hypothetical protein